MTVVRGEAPLGWRDVAAIARGEALALSPAARGQIAQARAIVEAIVAGGRKVYGVNTGVGALCDVVVPRDQQRALSRNIVFSHAVGVGPMLARTETRAIMAAAINNFAHGHSGVRPETVDLVLSLLEHDCLPEVPSRGSVGYLTHMAHVALVLIGAGRAEHDGKTFPGKEALGRIGRLPLVLDTKEGLSLVNGTPCATGLACVALDRAVRFLDWADGCAALTFETLEGQLSAFGEDVMAFHRSPGVVQVATRLRSILAGSDRLANAAGRRLQDALSLRAVPHVHGAARDAVAYAAEVVDCELASVTDNPVVHGSPSHPSATSAAHAVGSGVALAMDTLGIAMAEVAAMAERRIDRLVNPLVSGQPAFLASAQGAQSGFMIAQYTAASLVNENRTLAAPSSLAGGITSGLQEDHLSHSTPAATKSLAILSNTARILGIELAAAKQAAALRGDTTGCAPGTLRLLQKVPAWSFPYTDDQPLADLLNDAARVVQEQTFDDPAD